MLQVPLRSSPARRGAANQKSSITKAAVMTKRTTTLSSLAFADWTRPRASKAFFQSFRDIWAPLFLMTAAPAFAVVFCHLSLYLDGNMAQLVLDAMEAPSVTAYLYSIWPSPFSPRVWRWMGLFLAFQCALVKLAPGKMFAATRTATGHVPIYKANGMVSLILTLVALWGLQVSGVWNPALLYDEFGSLISALNFVALTLCSILFVKGHVAPSGADSGSRSAASSRLEYMLRLQFVQDFYWGLELYPRIASFDVKQMTNCRLGMMFWAVALLCFCYKNLEVNDGMLHPALGVSVFLQLIYIIKFFHWEMGYMCSMDIQHDRAGFYICWGCLVWLPAIYTSQSFALTTLAVPEDEAEAKFAWYKALATALFGFVCIAINYDSDRQRYVFRQTKAQCKIWGKCPPVHIVAEYHEKTMTTVASDQKTPSKTTKKDKGAAFSKDDKPTTTITTTITVKKQSLLLVDGWWRISRHFHYVPEILASLSWSAFVVGSNYLDHYFYPLFLLVLLTDRAFRDDARCRAKYGRYWEDYCNVVPYKIVPGVV